MKIAVESEQTGPRFAWEQGKGRLARRLLDRGDGWSVSDVACAAGPRDRPFQEQHSQVAIAIVVEGSFQYRSSAGRELMTPGSLFLGNAGQYFECGHEHAAGDRCVSFAYEPEYFESVAAETGARNLNPRFRQLRVPPVRELSGLISRVVAGLAKSTDIAPRRGREQSIKEPRKLKGNPRDHASHPDPVPTEWEEIALELAARALEISNGGTPSPGTFPAAEARITRIVRMIERHPDAELTLHSLAHEARLSRYHFLRVFQQLIGLPPHRYLLRARLRRAATQLVLNSSRILDTALDCGFGDVSNFNHAFRTEFGANPLAYRRKAYRSRSKA